jgi:hypothetical protein
MSSDSAAVRCQGPGEGSAAHLSSDITRRNPTCIRWIKCAAAATRTAAVGYEVGWSILGATLGGSCWATEMAICPSGDSSKMCRATKAICERSCRSNFWLPRVDIRRCGPVFVVALEFGLDTKPAPWFARARAWPSQTLHCFRLALVMITMRFCGHSRARTGLEPLAPAFGTVHGGHQQAPNIHTSITSCRMFAQSGQAPP